LRSAQQATAFHRFGASRTSRSGQKYKSTQVRVNLRLKTDPGRVDSSWVGRIGFSVVGNGLRRFSGVRVQSRAQVLG